MASSRKAAACRNDCGLKPMPQQNITIELNHEYTAEEMENIKLGFVPQEMDDRWFIYYDQTESKLFMHRSWTGYCDYIVQFTEKAETSTFMATTAIVNRDESQYSSFGDDYDEESILSVISSLLLQECPGEP
jgi:8-oxo-dGTP diphosphatase